MLHINIIGVVTFSDDSTRMTCHVYHWIFFLQFIYYHYTVPLLQRQHQNTRKKN